MVRAVIQHELAHLVGLAHIDRPAELMFPETSQQRDFGPGDLTGLATMGAGTCVPEI